MSCVAQFFQVWGSMIQTIALVATLIVIIFYAVFTYQLRKATVRHTELSLRPCVTINFRERYTLANIGLSPALNIRIEPVETDEFIYRFETLDLLESNTCTDIIGKDFEKKHAEKADYLPPEPFTFLSSIKADEFILIINYENIENKSYQSQVKVNRILETIKFLETKNIKKGMQIAYIP